MRFLYRQVSPLERGERAIPVKPAIAGSHDREDRVDATTLSSAGITTDTDRNSFESYFDTTTGKLRPDQLNNFKNFLETKGWTKAAIETMFAKKEDNSFFFFDFNEEKDLTIEDFQAFIKNQIVRYEAVDSTNKWYKFDSYKIVPELTPEQVTEVRNLYNNVNLEEVSPSVKEIINKYQRAGITSENVDYFITDLASDTHFAGGSSSYKVFNASKDEKWDGFLGYLKGKLPQKSPGVGGRRVSSGGGENDGVGESAWDKELRIDGDSQSQSVAYVNAYNALFIDNDPAKGFKPNPDFDACEEAIGALQDGPAKRSYEAQVLQYRLQYLRNHYADEYNSLPAVVEYKRFIEEHTYADPASNGQRKIESGQEDAYSVLRKAIDSASVELNLRYTKEYLALLSNRERNIFASDGNKQAFIAYADEAKVRPINLANDLYVDFLEPYIENCFADEILTEDEIVDIENIFYVYDGFVGWGFIDQSEVNMEKALFEMQKILTGVQNETLPIDEATQASYAVAVNTYIELYQATIPEGGYTAEELLQLYMDIDVEELSDEERAVLITRLKIPAGGVSKAEIIDKTRTDLMARYDSVCAIEEGLSDKKENEDEQSREQARGRLLEWQGGGSSIPPAVPVVPGSTLTVQDATLVEVPASMRFNRAGPVYAKSGGLTVLYDDGREGNILATDGEATMVTLLDPPTPRVINGSYPWYRVSVNGVDGKPVEVYVLDGRLNGTTVTEQGQVLTSSMTSRTAETTNFRNNTIEVKTETSLIIGNDVYTLRPGARMTLLDGADGKYPVYGSVLNDGAKWYKVSIDIGKGPQTGYACDTGGTALVSVTTTQSGAAGTGRAGSHPTGSNSQNRKPENSGSAPPTAQLTVNGRTVTAGAGYRFVAVEGKLYDSAGNNVPLPGDASILIVGNVRYVYKDGAWKPGNRT